MRTAIDRTGQPFLRPMAQKTWSGVRKCLLGHIDDRTIVGESTQKNLSRVQRIRLSIINVFPCDAGMRFVAQIAHLVETHNSNRQVKVLGDRTIKGSKMRKKPSQRKNFSQYRYSKGKALITSKRLKIEQNYTLGTNRKPISSYRLVPSHSNSDAAYWPKLLPV